ncbi:hypothetical protein TorRG33x02_110660 [Trema orientale]|uniref:Uncharacterized protein n=1 Tax=Trema orientale TaxID=63057 RepID=A0A2P5F5U4_TREOI|nr:hypothetical protein TorRG33x02_110660 [Trema orientale]
MKIAVALLVAFVMVLLRSVEAANAKSSIPSSAKTDDGHDENNLGRKVNVGAINNKDIDEGKTVININTIEEDDNDVNEAYNKTGSNTAAKSHHQFDHNPGNKRVTDTKP